MRKRGARGKMFTRMVRIGKNCWEIWDASRRIANIKYANGEYDVSTNHASSGDLVSIREYIRILRGRE